MKKYVVTSCESTHKKKIYSIDVYASMTFTERLKAFFSIKEKLVDTMRICIRFKKNSDGSSYTHYPCGKAVDPKEIKYINKAIDDYMSG